METPGKAAARLLGALEVLYGREAAQIAAGDHKSLLETQERTRAVVDGLRRLGGSFEDGEARELGARVLALRRDNQERIGAAVSRIRGELASVHAGQRRMAMLAPAYITGRRGTAPRVLAARG